MKTALDTNILSALWSGEPLASRISNELSAARALGALAVCGPVFAELIAHPAVTERFIENFLRETGIAVDFEIGEDVWREAGKAYAAYALRRRKSSGGTPKRLLVDFVIASHASQHADRLMTLDASRYLPGFPKLRIVSPTGSAAASP